MFLSRGVMAAEARLVANCKALHVVNDDHTSGATSHSVLCINVAKDGMCVVGTECGAFVSHLERPDFVKITSTGCNSSEVPSAIITDCSVIYVASGDKISIIDTRESLDGSYELVGNTDEVNKIALRRDETRLAAADDNGEAIVYDLKTRSPLKVLRKGHQNICSSALFVENDKLMSHLLTAGLDCQIALWDYSRPKLIYTHNTQNSLADLGDSSVFMFNPPMVNGIELYQEEVVIAALGNGCIEFLDIHQAGKLNSFGVIEGHASTGASSVCLFEEETIMVTGGNDNHIKVWDIAAALENKIKSRNLGKKKKKRAIERQLTMDPQCIVSTSTKINCITSLGPHSPKSFIVGDQTNTIKVYQIEGT